MSEAAPQEKPNGAVEGVVDPRILASEFDILDEIWCENKPHSIDLLHD